MTHRRHVGDAVAPVADSLTRAAVANAPMTTTFEAEMPDEAAIAKWGSLHPVEIGGRPVATPSLALVSLLPALIRTERI